MITEVKTREPTKTEAAILALLRLHGEMSTQQVADGIERDLSRASRVLNRLKRVNLVVSRNAPDEQDPRTTWKLWRLAVAAK